MSTILKLPSGSWRAQVRRKGRYVSQAFARRRDAQQWALKVNRGESVSKRRPDHINTAADLVDLHIDDMREVGKLLRRSKAYSLQKLKEDVGHLRIEQVDRASIIQFARDRRSGGAGPVTIAMDISYLKTIMLRAAAVHGVQISVEQVDLARTALSRLGLVGKGRERDRRPTQDELDALIAYFESNSRLFEAGLQIEQVALVTGHKVWKTLKRYTSTCFIWSERRDSNPRPPVPQSMTAFFKSVLIGYGVLLLSAISVRYANSSFLCNAS
jgi:hypothetical protein